MAHKSSLTCSSYWGHFTCVEVNQESISLILSLYWEEFLPCLSALDLILIRWAVHSDWVCLPIASCGQGYRHPYFIAVFQKYLHWRFRKHLRRHTGSQQGLELTDNCRKATKARPQRFSIRIVYLTSREYKYLHHGLPSSSLNDSLFPIQSSCFQNISTASYCYTVLNSCITLWNSFITGRLKAHGH